MEKIKVLWMNNGEEDVYSIISDAIEYDIEIEKCKSFTECRRLLSPWNGRSVKYDAVIINAFCKMLNEVPIIGNLNYALDWLERECSRIPWFIVNTKENMERRDKMNLSTTLKSRSVTFFSSFQPQSKWKLLDSILQQVDKLPHRKYAKELCVCREQERDSLLNLLWKFQNNDDEISVDHTIPTDCRKVLEGIRNSAFLGKIRIPNINKPEKELNKFSKQIGDVESGIPEYVKRSFHRCCNISQEGSHASETDKMIKQCKAPYLTKSLIYDLLNILSWIYDINK